MHRIRSSLLIALVALLVAPLSSATGSGLPRRYSADAFFVTTSGCVQTFVGVYPVAAKDRGTGQIFGASMNVQYERYDTCAGTFLLRSSSGVVFFVADEFSMSPGLNKASLHSSTTVHDEIADTDIALSIDLVYRAIGPRSACSEQVTPDETTTFCIAVVEGTVSDGAVNLTPNLGEAVFQEHRAK